MQVTPVTLWRLNKKWRKKYIIKYHGLSMFMSCMFTHVQRRCVGGKKQGSSWAVLCSVERSGLCQSHLAGGPLGAREPRPQGLLHLWHLSVCGISVAPMALLSLQGTTPNLWSPTEGAWGRARCDAALCPTLCAICSARWGAGGDVLPILH